MLKRCAFALILFWSFCALFAAAQSVPTQTIDVTYDPAEQILRGTLDVTLSDAPETVYFLLLPNLGREPNPHLSRRIQDDAYPFGFEPSSLDVVTVVQSPSGAPLSFRLLRLPPTLQTYSLDETVLAVDIGGVGLASTLQIRFETAVPRVRAGDEGITSKILTYRFGWYPLLVEESASVLEENGAVSIEGESSFPFLLPWTNLEAIVRAPSDLVLLSGADRVERQDASEDWAVSHAYFTTPTRSFAIVLGAGYDTYVLDGPTPIEVAHRPGREDDARLIATYARDILDAYEPLYGAYPRARLTIVEGTNRSGTSFAADGILWLSDLFFTHNDVLLPGVLNRYTEFVLAHEIAHQWFGIGTGVDLDRDNWLSEGLCQYASINYFESRFGETGGNLFSVVGEGLLEEAVDRQFGFYNLREHEVELPYLLTVWSGFDEEIVKPSSETEYVNASASRYYHKGYLVARTVASAVGAEIFDRSLRTAFARYRGRVLDVDALQSIVEEESGADLDALFETWLYGDIQADYAAQIVSKRQLNVGYETIVEVSRRGGIAQPVEVEVTLDSGATSRQTWDGSEAVSTLLFSTPSPVRRVAIDPEHRIPDTNRLNNNDPVRIVSAVNRAALPLDAYVLTPDPTTGGFSFGWLDRFRVTVTDEAATLRIREGRHHSIAGTVDLGSSRLTGNFTYTYTVYDQPETGMAGTYWIPDVQLRAIMRRHASAEGPFWSAGFVAVDLPSLASSSVRSIAVDLAEGGAMRLALSAFGEVRLVPQLYLQGVGTLGISAGDLPDPMRFSFDEIRTWEQSPKRFKLTGRLSIELRTQAEPYNVLNVAMLDANRSRLFVSGGLGWTTPGDCCTTIPYVEAGVEQVFELSTLGGLLPIEVTLGVATPISDPARTMLYVGVSL